jgi:hypothetical protein
MSSSGHWSGMPQPRVALIGLFVLCTGCMTTSAFQTASVVPGGKVRFLAAAEDVTVFGGTPVGYPPKYEGYGNSSSVPQLETGARLGLGNGWDVGVKGWLLGGQLEAKKELFASGPHVLSLGAAAGLVHGNVGNGVSASNYYVFSLPLFYGVRFRGSELVISPRLTHVMVPANSIAAGTAGGNALYAGGSVGIAIRLAEGVYLMPEVSWALTLRLAGTGPGILHSSLDEEDTSAPEGRLRFLQFGVGFLFGTDK